MMRILVIHRRLPRLILVALLGVGLLASGNGESGQSAAEYFQQAKAYQQTGDLKASIIQLKNLLQADPQHANARRLLGENYLATADFLAAKKELYRALDLGVSPASVALSLGRTLLSLHEFEAVLETIPDPDALVPEQQADAWGLRGHALLAQRRLQEAADAYDRALALHPDAPEAGLGQARLAGLSGDLTRFRRRLEQVVAANPGFASAWSLLGAIERRDNNAEAAEHAYTQAIKHRSNNSVDLINRALMRIFLERYDDAESDIDRLEKRDRNNPGVSYSRGLLAFQRGDYKAAESALQRSLAAASNSMPAIYYFGLTSYRLNKIETAERYLARFIGANPGAREATRLLGAIYLAQGKVETAARVLKPALELYPDDQALLELMADIALTKGSPAESNRYQRQLIELRPEESRAYMKLGLGLAMTGDQAESNEVLGKILGLPQALEFRKQMLIIVNHFQAGELDQSITIADALLKQEPANPAILQLKAVALLGKGDEPGARDAYLKALEVAPGDPSTLHNLARLELARGRIQQARDLYAQVLQYRSNHSRTLVALAQLEASQDDFAKAEKWLELAVKNHPSDLQPKLLLASLRIRSGQPVRALGLLQGLEQTPAVLALTGEAYLAQGEQGSALSALVKLVKAEPEAAQAHYLLAKAYGQSSDARRVREELAKALALEPEHFYSRVALARQLIQEEELAKAQVELDRLEQAAPSHPEVLTLRGWLADALNNPKVAIVSFEAALKAAPSSRNAKNLASAQWRSGQRAAARRTLEAWLEKNPGDAQAHLFLANQHLRQERTAEAIESFTRVVELAPNHIWSLNNLAWLVRNSDPQRALVYAEQARQYAPDSPAVLDTLGLILIEQNRAEEAVQHLSSASKKAPDDRVIRFHLAQAIAQSGETEKARELLKSLLDDNKPFAFRQNADSLLKSLGG